jgi:sugar porter (SP) family MFS transporter
MASPIAKFKTLPLWREMTPKAVFVAMVACMGALIYGYDVSWWSSVLGMPYFTKQYGVYNEKTGTYSISASLQSAGSAIPTAGLTVGAVLCHLISDRWGRRIALLLTSIGYIVAIIIEVTSNSFWQVVIGRFFNSIPQGLAAVLIPMYQAECAPASCRGTLIGIYTWFVDMGAVIAVGIIYHTNARQDAGSYKIVMGCQVIFPLAILACLRWMPETPRYLCMKGRDEEARQVLLTLRKEVDKVEHELAEIHASLQVHQEQVSWLELFRGSNLRRTIITVFVATIESWQGLSFIGNYLVVFFISLGTTETTYELVLLINATLFMTLTFFFWAPDYFGRRTLLMFGTGVMFASFFIMAGVGGKDVSVISSAKQQVCIAMLFIWTIVYSSTVANLTWVTIGEIPTTRLKSKTGGLAFGLQCVSSIVITIFSPYVQSDEYTNWGAYIGFFFGSFSFIAFWFVYFFYPEVKGLSIEEMDLLFELKAPVSEFSKITRGDTGLLQGVSDTRAAAITADTEKCIVVTTTEKNKEVGIV